MIKTVFSFWIVHAQNNKVGYINSYSLLSVSATIVTLCAIAENTLLYELATCQKNYWLYTYHTGDSVDDGTGDLKKNKMS